MADVQPFRAVRYSSAAGPLADLVAPPYDAVTADERARLFTRSPYNVVHLTLPDSAKEAGDLYRTWLAEGVLEREDDLGGVASGRGLRRPGRRRPAPERRRRLGRPSSRTGREASFPTSARIDGSARSGAVCCVRRTSTSSRSSSSSTASSSSTIPNASPDLEADGAKLWRAPELDLSTLGETPLLIADGHHRYESALEYAEETAAADPRIMALVVSTTDPGLHVFPTHRNFSDRPDLRAARDGEPCADLDEALARLADEPFSHSAAVAYRADGVELVTGAEGELDVELIDGHGLDGIGYTPLVADAVGAVDRGEADVAFLLREPRVGDVFATARQGRRMPPKSTYFFPKPLSGLLFHPLEAS